MTVPIMHQKRCRRATALGSARLAVLFIRPVGAGHAGRIDWQKAPALVRKPDEGG